MLDAESLTGTCCPPVGSSRSWPRTATNCSLTGCSRTCSHKQGSSVDPGRCSWRADADPRQAIFALVGAIIHRVLLERAGPTGQWLDGLVELVHRGVRADPPL